jgi:hypothetical protein
VSYHVTDWLGGMENSPAVERMREVISDLEDCDEEHPSVALTHETEWCLGYYRGRLLIWENLEGNSPRHMRDVSPDRVLELWLALSRGDLERIEAEPWQRGYG